MTQYFKGNYEPLLTPCGVVNFFTTHPAWLG